MHSITISELGVFLVEPSGVQAQFITRRLEELGVIRIKTFSDAKTALAEMRRQTPDLVISSLHLPDMTGAELVQAMRDDEQLREIAFILVSSETNPHYLEPVRQAGACAILPKPVETATLRTALLASLDYLQPNTLKLDVSGIDLESLRVLVVDDSRSARACIVAEDVFDDSRLRSNRLTVEFSLVLGDDVEPAHLGSILQLNMKADADQLLVIIRTLDPEDIVDNQIAMLIEN